MNVSHLKKSVLSAVAFFGTLGILSVGYSAFVTSYPASSSSGSALSSAEWNKSVSAIQTLDTALSNFTFDSTTVSVAKHLVVNSPQQYVLWNAGSHSDVAAIGIKNTDSNRVWGLGVGGTGVGTVGLQGGKFGIWDTTASANRLTIDTNGYVGIGGVTSPAAPFHISNAGLTYGALLLGPNTANGSLISGESTGDMSFWSGPFGSGPFRMTIKKNGNVGIGSPTAVSKLTLSNNVSAGGPSSSFSSYQILLYENASAPNNSYGIGISSNTLWFNSNAYFDFYAAGARVASISNDGTYTKISDRNLKAGIETLSGSLDKILSLRGVSYEWKDSARGTGRHVGLIAQELENEYPELVRTNPDGIKTVDYAGLVAPLIEAVKEQQIQISELRNRLDERK